MRVLSWNVNGLRSAMRKGFEKFLEEESPDMLCLQEIKTDKPIEFEGYRSYWSFAGKKGYSGTAILTKEGPLAVSDSVGDPGMDREGRFLLAEYPKFFLADVYLPHGSRYKSKMPHKMACYAALQSFLARKRAKPLVVCGDFNVAHTELDLARPKDNTKNTMFTPEERAEFQRILDLGFLDAFRSLHPGQRQYTWWPFRGNLRERDVGWRLDYVLVQKSMAERVRKAFVLPEVKGSDHCPAGIELSGL